MKGILLASLLSSASYVAAHPAQGSSAAIHRRTIDLNTFRLPLKAKYVNSTKIETDPAASAVLVRRGDYVDAATQLVKKKFPGSTFRVVNDHYVGTNGIAHVNFKQTANGIDIDNADFNVNVAADGTIFSFGNSFFNGQVPPLKSIQKRARVDPVEALKGASSTLQLPVKADSATAHPLEGKEIYTIKGTSGAVKDPEARLVYFQTADGNLKLTWRVETDILSNWLLTYVDAQKKEEVVGVVDYSADATYQVFPWGFNDPTESTRQLLVDPWNKVDSEFTWQGDGRTTYTTTRGNNGIAQSNPSGGNSYLNNHRPSSSTSNFQYPYSNTTGSPSQYVDAAITQLFYTANTYHDLLYELGFTEEAGNFETNNDGQGGIGNDAVILNVQDGADAGSKNNANFQTPPDGQPGRMRMFIWDRTTPNRDCAFEAGVVIHEFTHGLSNRLTGGPANSNCLNALESGGMGEGWGDFMATAIRLKPKDTRATSYSMGAWVSGNPAGIRKYLYSTSLTINPYQYGDLNALNEVHAIGEVWATMLYEVMWNLIDKYGKNDAPKPTLKNGVPTDGKYLAMKLVIDGMALQPCSPNFVQARDSIIDADTALTGGANKCDIWKAFAKRGLGQGAKYSASGRTASNKLPTGC
ncbi:extracellular metallo proteinase MEP [Myriangium duriaei CBS 260.36]|uniref:Extracellular metalloproteinase n=1 Tax=Myriangium duriaei CBS 260.36 TaxID=1168546 RepID=A0A9P4J7I1_9PEZI|nr:extracellular metallo proteinase MEP [Myriangium duriaei CBS 260.36]